MVLSLHVQPRAGRDEVTGEHGGRLRIRVRAAPVDDAANRAVIALIADAFGVPRARVTLIAGASARRKEVAVDDPARLPPWWPAAPGATPHR